MDNAFDSLGVVVADSAHSRAYVIRMDFYAEVYGSTEGTDRYESRVTLGNKVARFTIFSLSDFDPLHPGHSSLNELFLYDWSPINDQLSSGYLFRASFPANDVPTIGDGISYLQLMVPPTILGKRQFVVEAVFEDSTRISDTTSVTLF